MTQQGGVLFINEEDGIWELVTGNPGIGIVWRNEDYALRDLSIAGWKIQWPFGMSPKRPAFRDLWFTGYGLIRSIQYSRRNRAGSNMHKHRLSGWIRYNRSECGQNCP